MRLYHPLILIFVLIFSLEIDGQRNLSFLAKEIYVGPNTSLPGRNLDYKGQFGSNLGLSFYKKSDSKWNPYVGTEIFLHRFQLIRDRLGIASATLTSFDFGSLLGRGGIRLNGRWVKLDVGGYSSFPIYRNENLKWIIPTLGLDLQFAIWLNVKQKPILGLKSALRLGLLPFNDQPNGPIYDNHVMVGLVVPIVSRKSG